MKHGAIASSVGHDSHNLCVVGVDEASMAAAANRLIETGGGFAVADDGKVVAELASLQQAYAGPTSYKYEGVFPLSTVPQDKDVAWRNDFAREVVDQMFSEF